MGESWPPSSVPADPQRSICIHDLGQDFPIQACSVNSNSPLDSHGCSLFHFIALRIHISQATKAILDDLGGFEVEERGEVFLKVRKFEKKKQKKNNSNASKTTLPEALSEAT